MSIKVTGSRQREAARPIQSRESSHEITVTTVQSSPVVKALKQNRKVEL